MLYQINNGAVELGAEVILKKDGKEIYRAEIKDDNPDDEMPSYAWKDSLDFKDNSTVDVYDGLDSFSVKKALSAN